MTWWNALSMPAPMMVDTNNITDASLNSCLYQPWSWYAPFRRRTAGNPAHQGDAAASHTWRRARRRPRRNGAVGGRGCPARRAARDRRGDPAAGGEPAGRGQEPGEPAVLGTGAQAPACPSTRSEQPPQPPRPSHRVRVGCRHSAAAGLARAARADARRDDRRRTARSASRPRRARQGTRRVPSATQDCLRTATVTPPELSNTHYLKTFASSNESSMSPAGTPVLG